MVKGELTNLQLKTYVISVRFAGTLVQFDIRHAGFSVRTKRADFLLELSNPSQGIVTIELLSSLVLDQWIIAINRTLALVPLLHESQRNEWFQAQQQQAIALQQRIGEGTTAVVALIDKSAISDTETNALARMQLSSGAWPLSDALLQLVGLQKSVVEGITDQLGVQAWSNELRSLLHSILATAFALGYLASQASQSNASAQLSERGRAFLRGAVAEQPMMTPFAVGISNSTWESFGIATLEQHSTKGIFARVKSLDMRSLVHQGVTCDGCRSSVTGIRWKCTACDDYGTLSLHM